MHEKLSLSSNKFIAMAFKKTLAQRLLNITKISSQTLTNCRISSSSVDSRISSNPIAPDPGDNGIFQNLLHKRPGSQPPSLLDKLKAMDIARNRIRLEGLTPPPRGVTVQDAKKLLRAAQVELVKSKLREIRNTCIPVSDFIRVCSEICSGDQDQAIRIAKMLDDSAAVIILGDVVFLRPEQEIETLLFRKI